MPNKRIRLSVSKKGNFLRIKRLVDIVRVDPYDDVLLDADGEKTEIEVTPDQLNRGYGFGSFLLNIKPEEIEYDDEVIAFLQRAINRQYSTLGDLFGFSLNDGSVKAYKDVFKDPYIVYGTLGDTLIVPQGDCQAAYNIFHSLEAAA